MDGSRGILRHFSRFSAIFGLKIDHKREIFCPRRFLLLLYMNENLNFSLKPTTSEVLKTRAVGD